MIPNDSFNLNSNDYLGRPLYSLDLDNSLSEKAILEFLNAHYKASSENPEDVNRFYNQIEDLAFYTGFACPLGNSEVVIPTDAGATTAYRKRKRFDRVAINDLKDIVDNLTSRFSIRKPNYIVYPKESFLADERGKARSAKKFLLSKAEDLKLSKLNAELISRCLIFGESYIEYFWDEDLGPFQIKDKEKRKEVTLVNENGEPELDDNDNPIKVNPWLKMGDTNARLWNPMDVITPREKDFDSCEWVILKEHVNIDKLRLRWPEQAEKIQETDNLEYFDTCTMTFRSEKRKVLVYKLYHRPTRELPEGRLIIATPTAILFNQPYPHSSVLDQELFPVLQLKLVDVPGSERGLRSIISLGKSLQLYVNNIINSQLRNIQFFPPIRVWEARSIDEDKLRFGVRTDITYNKRSNPPQILSTEPVSQSALILVGQLRQMLKQLSNVLPISRGETIPNTESRLMLDFFKDQELSQSLPFDDKVKKVLSDGARLLLSLAASEYGVSEAEKTRRRIRFFGNKNRLIQEDLDIDALTIPYDIELETLNSFSDTFQGRVQQITQLQQIVPGAMTPSKILDILEVSGSEEFLDAATAAVDLAQKEINDILDGRDVSPPQKYVDLIPYYEQYVRALQKPEIRDLLPDVYDPSINTTDLSGKQKIAQTLLDQITAVELLLLEAIENQEAQRIVDERGISALRVEVMSRFPTFPMLYKSESAEVINPLDILEQAIPTDPPMEEGLDQGLL